MTWKIQVNGETGEVTLTDPAGTTVDTVTGSDAPTVRTDRGEPVDPDVRSLAADHLLAEYNAGNIDLPTAVTWAMERFEVK